MFRFPYSFRGLARTARAGWWLITLHLAGGAAVCAFLIGVFLVVGPISVISRAVQRLPEKASITRGRLEWPAEAPAILAGNNILELRVGEPRAELEEPVSVADFIIGLGFDHVWVQTRFGRLTQVFAPDFSMPLDRSTADPWWGSRRHLYLFCAVVGLALAILCLWFCTGFGYGFAAWLLAFFSDRELSFGQACRLCSLALIPGGVVLCAGLACYGLLRLSLNSLALVFLVHMVIGWCLVVGGVLSAPRVAAVRPGGRRSGNPFAG